VRQASTRRLLDRPIARSAGQGSILEQKGLQKIRLAPTVARASMARRQEGPLRHRARRAAQASTRARQEMVIA
jgi:hypothetical protein